MAQAPTAFTGAVTLAAAQEALAAAIRSAESLGVAVSVAVVDAGGVLKAFTRMDGAEIAGEVLAVDKAYTAVAHRAATAELAPLAAPGGELFGLHANGGGRYVLFAGGLPVLVDGVAVGAVGVSGGTADEDAACAESALTALLASL